MRTPLEAMTRGFRSAVTVNGNEVNGRLKALDAGNPRSISLVGGEAATYELLYEQQLWVHAVVNRLARGISRLPWKVYVNPDEPHARERVREGPLAELLERPHPKGPSYVKQAIVSNVAIHGNCVLVKARRRAGTPPVALIPSSFAYWEIVVKDGEVLYIYNPRQGPGAMQYYREEDVVHFMWWATRGGLKATSPLEALRRTLMMEDATQRHIIQSFENGARPTGAFSVEGTLKEGVPERMLAQLNEIYGGVENAGKIALLEGGAKWQNMEHTLVESSAVALRQITREETAAAYNMPPPSVGILDRATFSNITEQHLMEYQDTVQPWTTMIQEGFEMQLIAPEPSMEGEYAEFDFGAVLAGDPVKQTETLMKAVGGGAILTPNEARARLNMPPIEDDEQASRLAPPPNASVGGGGEEGETMGQRIEAAGALVRAGWEPADALRTVGLPPMEHLGMPPVTLQAVRETVPPPDDGNEEE